MATNLIYYSTGYRIDANIAPIEVSDVPYTTQIYGEQRTAYYSAAYYTNNSSNKENDVVAFFDQQPTITPSTYISSSDYTLTQLSNGYWVFHYSNNNRIFSSSGMAHTFNNRSDYLNYITTVPIIPITSNGGGATHIAKQAGLLSSIGASNLSDILMVSGGGGGGLIIGEDTYAGKDAGGISGNGNNSANQTTGYSFGQGESAEGVSGGGGGLYGGYKGVS